MSPERWIDAEAGPKASVGDQKLLRSALYPPSDLPANGSAASPGLRLRTGP